MIDPLLSLAFSIHANKGVYALLLGSGVSRSARIPTGWEVVLDLIRKLAHTQGENCGDDPSAWYRARYAENPDYSQLLDQLGKAPSDRSQILRRYFEPTDEERAQGLKRPTPAHRAIARLVTNGYIKVIVTTNFDRLMEQALEEHGIQPSIISTPEAVDGARPLVHSGPTIVKIHGDYLDERIKNTLAELESYDRRLDQLLDRIWAEFGVITCGWSADWDVALLKSFERCPNHRYAMYWTGLGAPSEKARRLISLRKAAVLTIKGADDFFTALSEKVDALVAFDRPHPLSAKVAAETVKNYLVDDKHRIRLEELVCDERERVASELLSAPLTYRAQAFDEAEYNSVLTRYESTCESLLAMIVAGSYWGEEHQIGLWTAVLDRLGSTNVTNAYDIGGELRLYPAVCLFYAAALAALAGRRWKTFVSLSMATRIRIGRTEHPASAALSASNFNREAAQHIARLPPIGTKYLFPMSENLHQFLREPLRRFIPEDEAYDLLFERLEYLCALGSIQGEDPQRLHRIMGGRYIYKGKRRGDEAVEKIIGRELSEQDRNWPLFRAGFGTPDWQRFLDLKKAFDAQIHEWAMQLW